MVELVNSGIAVSQTISKDRQVYGSQFRLTVDPNLIGMLFSLQAAYNDAETSETVVLPLVSFASTAFL